MHIPLEVIELSKLYNKKEAVKNISFKINKNEIIGILGPNGCGKTTTIGMILGLLKPSKGKVLINGIEIENKRVDLLSNLNFISPYVELPKKLSVKQNLAPFFNASFINLFPWNLLPFNAKNISPFLISLLEIWILSFLDIIYFSNLFNSLINLIIVSQL